MRRRLSAIAVALGVLALLGYAIGATPPGAVSPNAPSTGGSTTGSTGTAANSPGAETARVTFVDETGETLGVVHARVADSPAERYQGLSGTESLANGSGMLFVYPEEGVRTFVMREMNYPIDMIFVGGDGHVTRIYHAEVPNSETLKRYEARAKWVVEVPYHWTTRHGVSTGDRVRIDR